LSLDFTVKVVEKEHVSQLVEFLTLCMPGSTVPKTEEFWRWKHFQNPFGVSPGLIAFNERGIISVRVFLRWSWKVNGLKIQAVRAVDTATHPDYRGRGLFSKLTQLLLDQMKAEDVSFIFNTPNKRSLPGYLQMGWTQVTRIPLLVRVLHPFHMVRKIIARVKNGNILHPEIPDGVNRLLQEPDLNRLLLNVEKDERYQTSRNLEYLKWRYSDIPGISYNARWHFKDSAWAILIFRERIRKNLHELAVCELLLSPGSDGVALGVRLLNEVADDTKADYMIATAAVKTSELRAFQQSAFFSIGSHGPMLTVRPLQPSIDRQNPLEWSNYRCSMGDLEIF
jgi:GNAT superfamily N-acetyltransferase